MYARVSSRALRAFTVIVAAAILAAGLTGCFERSSPVKVSFTGTPRTGATPLAVSFAAQATAAPPYTVKFRDMTPLPDPTPMPDYSLEIDEWNWDFGDGTTGQGKDIEHVYTQPGTYSVSLTVIVSNGDTVVETRDNYIVAEAQGNRAPVANAGIDRAVDVGTLVQLDGTASSDPDGDALTYLWAITSAPDTSAAALDNTASPTPSFTPDAVGVYSIQLVVSDGALSSNPDIVTVNAGTPGPPGNTPPIAEAGPARMVLVGSTVNLDGGDSFDPDGDTLTYLWSFVSIPEASATSITGPDTQTPSFVADVEGTYVVRLVVNDGHFDSPPDTVTITTGDTTNTAPVARIRYQQPYYVPSEVLLDAMCSVDNDGDTLTCSWSFVSTPGEQKADFTDPAAECTSFTAEYEGDYVVRLVVNDGKVDSEPATATITLKDNNAPRLTLDALSYTVVQGQTLTIPVRASDPDGDVVALGAGPALENSTFTTTPSVDPTATFTFTPDASQRGISVISFKARDPIGLSDTKHVQINVTGVNHAPTLTVAGALSVDEGDLVTIPLKAADPDGDVLTVTAAPLPDNAIFIEPTGTITFAPDYDQAGVYRITCQATDGRLSSGPQVVEVTVNDVTAVPGQVTKLDLTAHPVENPTLLKQVRVSGTVNPSDELPPPSRITCALITGVEPASAGQGETLDVVLTGQSVLPGKARYPTNFIDKVSAADFGAGITVNSLKVTGAHRAVANITVANNSDVGVRGVQVKTLNEIAVCMLAFNVVPGGADVTGVVVDPATGKPIAGAIVSIAGTNISTTTDADGRYLLRYVPTGHRQLIINARGHALIRMGIEPQLGMTVDMGQTETESIVFDPSAPPSATALSIIGRGMCDITGDLEFEEAEELVQDAMQLVGGFRGGMVDAYGVQVNPRLEGSGAFSLTVDGCAQLADRLANAESHSLQRVLHAVSFAMEWTNGPIGLGEWMESLQSDVERAWLDPTHPQNALLVLVFNKGKSLLPEAPELVPETRLNALQAFLFISSLTNHAVNFESGPVQQSKRGSTEKATPPNNPPFAAAGPDQSTVPGATVSLDGSRSRDLDGDPINYSWKILYKPALSKVRLNSSTIPKPSFVPDVEGYYKVQLTVDDGTDASVPDYLNVTVDRSSPLADAGLDRRVNKGDVVRLDAALSEDPGGRPLNYEWSFYSVPDGTKAVLSDPAAVNPTFEADVDGEFVIQLIADNAAEKSQPDFVVITAGNRSPVAYPGRDRIAGVKEKVELDGSLSSDPDGDPLTYSWAMVSRPAGSAAIINEVSAGKTFFILDVEGDYQLELRVRDAASESEPAKLTITTNPPDYFSGYWRNFFDTKQSMINAAYDGWAREEEMKVLGNMAMLPGAGNIAGAKVVAGIAGKAPDLVGQAMISGRVALMVPQAPTILRAEVITEPDGSRHVQITFSRSPSDKTETTGSPGETFVYRLFRFQGDTRRRVQGGDLQKRDQALAWKIFKPGDDLKFTDEKPLMGTHFYAINVTRYVGQVDTTNPRPTSSWWPTALGSSLNAFEMGSDRLTSDYSEQATVYYGPGDFSVTFDGLEMHPDPDLNILYYSDATKGVFYAIYLDSGCARLQYASAGFKKSERDGRTIVQNGLAIDRDGNLYSDNAASDASFGGRLFRFSQPNGSREICGTINYFSELLMFAQPVFSGPMVIRPVAPPAKETLLVVENLSQKILEVDVNEKEWRYYRRVGKPFASIPPGGWGRVVDLEWGVDKRLYMLDGLRVIAFEPGKDPETYASFKPAKQGKEVAQ